MINNHTLSFISCSMPMAYGFVYGFVYGLARTPEGLGEDRRAR